LVKVLLSMSRRQWRWQNQTIDQLLHAPEEMSHEALATLHRCAWLKARTAGAPTCL
jgi:hypothetical protein